MSGARGSLDICGGPKSGGPRPGVPKSGEPQTCTEWSAVKPVVTTATLVTQDGVPIDTVHLPGRRDLAIVMAHGFTQSWQTPMVWNIAQRFNLAAGVVTFDFRGHGRSGRAVHGRRQGDRRPRRGRALCSRARLPADRDGGVLHGRLGRAAPGRAARGSRRSGLGERAGPLVLPRHRADAPGALRRGSGSAACSPGTS